MTRPAPRFLPAAAACVALAAVPLTACGSSSSDSSSSSSDTAAPTTTAAAPTTTAAAPTTTAAAPTTTAAASAEGKQVFASAGCAGCHTLKAAGASGQVGPNLDQLKPAAAAVEAQVTAGGGGMPAFKDQLSPAQIKAVSAYVASVAGQ